MRALQNFFSLDEDVQQEIVKEYNKRATILYRMGTYERELKELKETLKSIQEDCTHPLLIDKKVWNEDEYGKMLKSGWVEYVCPDCHIRWNEDFDE